MLRTLQNTWLLFLQIYVNLTLEYFAFVFSIISCNNVASRMISLDFMLKLILDKETLIDLRESL